MAGQDFELREQPSHLFLEVNPSVGGTIKIFRLGQIVHAFGRLKGSMSGKQADGSLDAVRQIPGNGQLTGQQVGNDLIVEIWILIEEQLGHLLEELSHPLHALQSLAPVDDGVTASRINPLTSIPVGTAGAADELLDGGV